MTVCTRRPSGFDIAYGDYHAKRLIYAIESTPGGMVDHVRPMRTPTVQGTPGFTVMPSGIPAMTFDGANDGYVFPFSRNWELPWGDVNDQRREHTLIVRCSLSAYPASWSIAAAYVNMSNLIVNSDQDMWATMNPNGAETSGIDGGLDIEHVWALTYHTSINGSVPEVYLDGERVGGLSSSTSLIATYNNTSMNVGVWTGSNLRWTGAIAQVRVMNRWLSPSEVQDHTFDPYCIYKRKRKVFGFVPAVGGFQSAWAANSNVLIQPGVL